MNPIPLKQVSLNGSPINVPGLSLYNSSIEIGPGGADSMTLTDVGVLVVKGDTHIVLAMGSPVLAVVPVDVITAYDLCDAEPPPGSGPVEQLPPKEATVPKKPKPKPKPKPRPGPKY